MEPAAALAAEGKGTAARDASSVVAMLGAEKVSAHQDPADKQKKVSEAGEKPAPSDDSAVKQKVMPAGVKLAPSEDPACKDKEDPACKDKEDPACKDKKVSAEVKVAPSEDPACKDKPAADKADGPADFPEDMVVAVAARLPSKAAGRSVLLSKTCRERLGEPPFLKSHLAPRSGFLVGDAPPTTLVLQPADELSIRHGYNHLTILVTPGNVVYDMPVRASGGADYYDRVLTSFDQWPQQQVRTPPPFFSKTVPDLDLALLGSEGRLLLAHSPRHGLFLCNPTEDRFVRLPAPPIVVNDRRTAAAIRYELGDWGEIKDFHVVLLSPLPSGQVALQRFSTYGQQGAWELTQIQDESTATVLGGVTAPGIYAREQGAFYWINERTGSLIQYVLGDRFLSVLSPPPRIGSKGWSLGCVDGILRLSSFSVPVPEDYGFVQIGGIDGILSVWILKRQGGWVLVKEASVPVAWAFHLYRGLELPVDMPSANAEFLVVRKDRELLWRDLSRDEVQFISNLYLREDSKVNKMYSSLKIFYV